MGVVQVEGRSGVASGLRESAGALGQERLAEARAALRMKFLVLAPRRLAALQSALVAAGVDASARRDLQRLGHQLRGTAATVGLVDVGLLGGVVESAAAARPFTDADHVRLVAAVALLEQYLARARYDRTDGALGADPRFQALLSESR